jgi:hypothetical protein
MIIDRKRSVESLVRASVSVLMAVIGAALAERTECGLQRAASARGPGAMPALRPPPNRSTSFTQ